MIELGKIQILRVLRRTEFGMYLNAANGNSWEDILLPNNQVPQGLTIGDEIEVFVYNDSKDRMIATLKTPKLKIGDPAVLKVAEITDFGAFLDWGLEKDLLLPFKEQIWAVKPGDEVSVALYVDKSKRLCATMKLYDLLSSESPFKQNDRVRGVIYRIHQELGCFVAVENKYHGMIPRKEMYGDFRLGDTVDARVKKVREDGKLELSVREAAYAEIEGDAQQILEHLKLNNGALQINDSSSPETIKAELGMSKKAFKRAVGRLLKEGAVKITQDGIEMQWK